MKKLISILCLLVAIIILTGCGKETTIEGTWTYNKLPDVFYIFNKNRTCSYLNGEDVYKCTYKTDKTRIIITYEGNSEENIFDYKLDDDKLTLTDSYGDEKVFNRKTDK